MLFCDLSGPAGQGTDEDIVVSSARAYVAALNKLVTWKAKQQPQQAHAQGTAAASAAEGAADAGRGRKKAAKAGKGAGKLVAAR